MKVKLTSDLAIAAHGCSYGFNQANWEEKFKGREGYITGKPVKPEANWVCGTDLVWPVIVNGIPGWLCRHQFEAGD